jgi:tyrosine-specific transport protein
MLGTGLLVLEVNVDVMKATGKKSASIVTMADRTLGVNGVRFAWAAYVFIHYALLVAYISRAGELLAGALPTGDFLEFLSRVPGSATPLLALVDSRSFAGTAYAAALGSVMFFSSPKTLDAVNGVLVVAVLALFAPLLGLAGSAARLENFTEPGDWTAVPSTIPVIALAFVFHNVVPVVSSQLEGDPEKSKTALIIGTAIPFCMFASWNAALLGSVSQRDALEALAVVARSGGDVQAFADPLVALQNTSRVASGLVSWFSFFAISTSFLGFVLGLVDFLTDGLGFERDDSRGGSKTPNGNDWRPFALALVPPWALALSYPDIFLDALDSAGTFGVLTLFGCMPPAMAWSTRYGSGPRTFQSAREDSKREPRNPKPHLVPGGKPVLVACFGLAAIVVFTESARKLGGVVFDR